jgi:DnaJ-class molecular chaperone
VSGRREAFRLLGITPDATEDEVRTAFRKKVIEHQPDTAVQTSDESTIRRLIDAYHLLTGPTVLHVKPGPGVHRIHVEHRPADAAQTTTRPRWCGNCRARGFCLLEVACPVCRGAALVTTLDIRGAQVAPCSGCRGRGRIRAMEPCRTCDGTGIDAI